MPSITWANCCSVGIAFLTKYDLSTARDFLSSIFMLTSLVASFLQALSDHEIELDLHVVDAFELVRGVNVVDDEIDLVLPCCHQHRIGPFRSNAVALVGIGGRRREVRSVFAGEQLD